MAEAAAGTPVGPAQLRAALGRYTTGVTIVTCLGAGGQPVGLTVNSFNALSLTPPLVLWSLRLESPSLAAFSDAGHFGVSVLAEDQIDLSRRFASSADEKFSAGDWAPGAAGVPLLVGAVAVFECSKVSQQTAGDHLLFIGEVLAVHEQATTPLVYHAGHYRQLGELL
ncbi:MAG: nitrilotriacetate monooxygenase [Leptothrix sp. (in: Bacteria)]|nr:nitrilotriacetate monooxygenase [Leptothrix sp. (in: b-proteobacteria)]